MCQNYIDSSLISFNVIVMSFGHILWQVRYQEDGYNLNSTSTMRQQPQRVVFGSLGAMCLEGPAHMLAIWVQWTDFQ